MNKGLLLGLALLFGASMFLGSAMPAWAAEGSKEQRVCAWDSSMARAGSSSGLVGALVFDQQKEAVGRVIDVTYREEWVTNFLIVSLCLPGMSDRLVAIPYTSSDRSAHVKSVTLALSQKDLEGAPSFSTKEWPNLMKSGWAQASFEYFAKTTYFRS